MFEQQIDRILTKLKKARKIDKTLKVFGASDHKYRIGKPLSLKKIKAFEKKYNFTLPECYKTFLLKIGHGNTHTSRAAAGPFYGISSLGKYIDELVENPEHYLNRPTVLKPNMTDKKWDKLVYPLLYKRALPDDEYEAEWGKVFSGILPIGEQGCTYFHTLVVSGKYTGRVVNIDGDVLNKPRFCFENNFLDWYERWLDEIISGILLEDNSYWFAYTMGGNDKELLNIFKNTQDKNKKFKAIYGLKKLISVSKKSCHTLLKIYTTEKGELRKLAIELLTKFSYQTAVGELKVLIKGNDNDCLIACQNIYCHARKTSKTWSDLLIKRLDHVNNHDTFRLIIYILQEAEIDYRDIVKQFCHHESKDIRESAKYFLKEVIQAEIKTVLVNLFMQGDIEESYAECILNESIAKLKNDFETCTGAVENGSSLPEYKIIKIECTRKKEIEPNKITPLFGDVWNRFDEDRFNSKSKIIRIMSIDKTNFFNPDIKAIHIHIW